MIINNIKSKFCIKIIFSFVDEGTKLKLINYNKNLQNKLNIGLINYKIFTKKYIIIDKKGIGEEYAFLDDDLEFKGEYLKGKRNGKGTEYDMFHNLCFEGEYLNGIKNGKGKEYNSRTFEVFEGEYLKGKKNGYGKVFDANKKLEFEGEYLNDKKNGKGKEYYDDGKLKFEGEYLNDKNWNGKEYDKTTDTFYEIKNGKGLIKELNYRGKLKFEIKENGIGKEYYFDGKLNCDGKLIFEGEYLNGKRNGKGKEYDYFGTLIFKGEYLNDKRNGKGKEYDGYDGKLIFEGEFRKWEKIW